LEEGSAFHFHNGSDDDNDVSESSEDDKADKSEKAFFRCPYCRRKTKAKYVDKSSMNYNDWLKTAVKSKSNTEKSDADNKPEPDTSNPDQTTKDNTTPTDKEKNDSQNEQDKTKEKDKEKENTEVVTWQYSGRNGGWWAYEPGHNEVIETKYQEFLTKYPDGAVPDDLLSSDDDDSNKKKKKKKKKPTAKSDDNDNKEKEWKCPIEIGYKEYVIDFGIMAQFFKDDKAKKRKVRRFIVDPTKITLTRNDSWKGCAGQFFNKT